MSTLRHVPTACLLAILAAGCADTPTTPIASDAGPGGSLDGAVEVRATPGFTFDWTVPDRFGFDADGDGLTDYPRTVESRQPSSFPVDLDACDVVGTRYHWFVDRRPVAAVSTCAYRHAFSAEGVYDVAVHVTDEDDASYWAEDVVTVQDWLVVSFGDSYASGEGVPEVPQANAALVASLESLFDDLEAARNHRDAAQANLASALEAKGLAEDVLQTALDRRAAFRAACSDIDGWSDILDCADFLTARALSFELYHQARDHFEEGVANAQERVADATAAFNEAQAAVNDAVSAVLNLRAAIEAARTGFTPPRWQTRFVSETYQDDVECHRSANAAPARAALALERSDPKTSVTFVHLACSGAKITDNRGNLTDQIPTAERLIGDREIDAVLMSIGGNDAGFANLAVACAVQEHCFDEFPAFDPAAGAGTCPFLGLVGLGDECDAMFGELPASAFNVLSAGLAVLPGRYEALATEMLPGLSGLLAPQQAGPGRNGRGRPAPPLEPGERVRAARVYITEYVDMTRDDVGAFCRFDQTDRLGTMPGFTLGELGWLDETAAGGINDAVRAAAETHGWTFVSGIHSGYRTHGYCAEDHWVVRAHETFLIQGDGSGIAHPNNAGHAFNATAILNALRSDLYPDGPAGAPRAPDQGRSVQTFAGR